MRSRRPVGTALPVVLAALLGATLAAAQAALWRDWHTTTAADACTLGCFPGGLHALAALWVVATLLTAGLAGRVFRAMPGTHGVVLGVAAVLLLVAVPLDPFPVLGRWVVLSTWNGEPLVRLVAAAACCVGSAGLLAWESIRLSRSSGAVRIATYDDPAVSPAGPGTSRRPPRPASPRRSPAASPARSPARRPGHHSLRR